MNSIAKIIGKIQKEMLITTMENLLTYLHGLEKLYGLDRNGSKLELIKEIYSTMAEFKKVEKPDLPPDVVKVGYKTSYSKRIDYADVYLFSIVSGDWNPIHHDEEFASKTRFKKRVVHGMLTLSLISNALALIPGAVVLVKQSVEYVKPVYIGDTVTAEAEIVEELPKGRYRVKVECKNQNEETVAKGECIILIWKVEKRNNK
uniref:MaoC family dehydratase n=1 Tax=Geoglobus ahangari TaxID=113653 RepID=A0A7C3UCG4_9EURY